MAECSLPGSVTVERTIKKIIVTFVNGARLSFDVPPERVPVQSHGMTRGTMQFTHPSLNGEVLQRVMNVEY